jgi:hypothetical protein
VLNHSSFVCLVAIPQPSGERVRRLQKRRRLDHAVRGRYNTAFREALHWENIVLAIKSNSFDKYQEINEVRRSCWNMYLLMCKRKSEVPKISEDDFEQQLLYIKKTLQELATVKELAAQGKFHLTEKARPKWKKPVQPS